MEDPDHKGPLKAVQKSLQEQRDFLNGSDDSVLSVHVF